MEKVKSTLEELKNEGKDVNAKNSNEMTCLDLGLKNGHVNVTEYLLANNADCMCNAEGSNGVSCGKDGQCSCKKEFHGRRCGYRLEGILYVNTINT